jgi:hypothetical protein
MIVKSILMESPLAKEEEEESPSLLRSRSCPCLYHPAAAVEHDSESYRSKCTECLQASIPSQNRPAPITGALKKAKAGTQDTLQNTTTTTTTPRADKPGVRFGSVDLHEHASLLGCHPDVRQGPPTTLSWCPVRSQHWETVQAREEDPEPHERITATTSGGGGVARSNKKPLWMLRTTSHQRTQLLQQAGYTEADLQVVGRELAAIKASRHESARDTSDLQRLMNQGRRHKEAARQAKREKRRRGVLGRFLSI